MDKELNFGSPEELEDELEITADLITLTDEEGVDHEFELLDTLDHENGGRYVALLAVPETPEEVLEFDGDLVVMKIIEEDGEEILSLIEDDDEFDLISEVFMDRLADLYEFGTEDEE